MPADEQNRRNRIAVLIAAAQIRGQLRLGNAVDIVVQRCQELRAAVSRYRGAELLLLPGDHAGNQRTSCLVDIVFQNRTVSGCQIRLPAPYRLNGIFLAVTQNGGLISGGVNLILQPSYQCECLLLPAAVRLLGIGNGLFHDRCTVDDAELCAVA